MDLNSKYPAISDLRSKARKRIPHFAWEYLDSATGDESTLHRNRSALDAIQFVPRGLRGEIKPQLATEFLGKTYSAPFGIAPVGMSGLMWPGAEKTLAGFAANAKIPYGMSTVATTTPEDVAPYLGDMGWFQMYPPRDEAIRNDMIKRVKDAGFTTLVVTIDVPAQSRRERQIRGGLVQPPRLTPRILAQVAGCPEWALRTALNGKPRMKMIETYGKAVMESVASLPSNNHVGYLLRTAPDHSYVKLLRDAWDGPLIVKGVMCPDDAAPLQGLGVDAVWVSNHAGRQFSGSPAAIDMLPAVKAATDLPIIFDSGIEGGLDMLRALALGADFVMMGRAWHYALGAIGAKGPAHLYDMLVDDLTSNMIQIAATHLSDLPDLLHKY
ncbi:MAG: alpha-hydroxy acid oxidase [Planktomarina sp.]|uniref:alpha-hydroxy acid oxidase n=1 Tax=Planktomarina sp. TaxID=2024851 RepID=UPI003C3E1778